MIFLNDKHREFYSANIEKTGSQQDFERQPLFYLLGLTPETRNHINDLYNFEENCIKVEGLSKPWQTGTSRRVCRLAFNLYNGTSGMGPEGETWSELYTPYHLFDCGMISTYMLEAIKIRFPVNNSDLDLNKN